MICHQILTPNQHISILLERILYKIIKDTFCCPDISSAIPTTIPQTTTITSSSMEDMLETERILCTLAL